MEADFRTVAGEPERLDCPARQVRAAWFDARGCSI